MAWTIDKYLALIHGILKRAQACTDCRRMRPRASRTEAVRGLGPAAPFHAARDQVGLKPLRFHDLRHRFGTVAVQIFPLPDIKAYMGHADIATTMINVHHVPRVDAAERLGAALAAAASSRPTGRRGHAPSMSLG